MACPSGGDAPLILACNCCPKIIDAIPPGKIALRPIGPLEVNPSACQWIPAITDRQILKPLAEILQGLALFKKASHVRRPTIDRWNHLPQDQPIKQFI